LGQEGRENSRTGLDMRQSFLKGTIMRGGEEEGRGKKAGDVTAYQKAEFNEKGGPGGGAMGVSSL